jgi:hypothetical protein
MGGEIASEAAETCDLGLGPSVHNKELKFSTGFMSEIPFSCATQIVSYRCSAEKMFL